MAFRIGRTLPPAAAPISLKDIMSGVAGLFEGESSRNWFEEELRDYYQVGHCFTVSSGKAALALILQALHDLSPERDEVLIPAYTCYSVPSAIIRAGLRVRLCDVSTETLDFDFDKLVEELANPRLLCVLPTHLFGLPADVERVKALARERGIFVVEDAAQAMGAEWSGSKLGSAGDAGLFSMGRGKAFSTVNGGIIVTDNDRIAVAIGKRFDAIPVCGALDSLKLLIYALAMSLLIHPWIFWLPKSLPFLKLGETRFDPDFSIRRLTSFQAGLAKGWINKIMVLKGTRAAIAEKITGYGIMSQYFQKTAIPDLIRFPVLLTDTDAKRDILVKSDKMGLGIADGYPDTIDGIEKLSTLPEGAKFPAAKDVAERIVTLPVHPFVKDRDVKRIAGLFKTMTTKM